MIESIHFECIKELVENGFGEPIDECLFLCENNKLNHFEINKLYLGQHTFAKDTKDECVETIAIIVLGVNNDKIDYKIIYHDFIFKYLENDEMCNYKAASKKVSKLLSTTITNVNGNDCVTIPDSLGFLNEDEDTYRLPISCSSGAVLRGWWINDKNIK